VGGARTHRATLGVAIALAAIAAPIPAASASRSPAAIRAYWTTARMRQAIPMPVVRVDPRSTATVGSDTSGRPLAIDPARPRASAASSGLHTEVRHTRRFPNRTHGKVFLTLNGLDYVCSGTAVRAPSHSLVNTAGHCLYETPAVLIGSGYATNWEFVPGYKNGHKPFGEWPAPKSKLRTTQQYVDSMPLVMGEDGDETYDLGFATVSQRNGKSLQDVVGARGIAFNQPRAQSYRSYGYPAESPPAEFDGEHLFRCDSPFKGSDPNFGDPQPMRILCDMTGGSSGGGWVAQRRVVSVNAYGYNGEPNKLYGPYFGDAAQSLYNSVKNG
jgi:hypothetical protein